ncbi:MAG: DUF6159 family protein [Acidobacteriota bacterium]|jgi:hypothetical protein
MAFGDRIARGWALMKQSWQVLMLDKELLVFPMISAVALILVALTFVVPLFTSGWVASLDSSSEPTANPFVYVWLFAFYVVNYFVVVFFNTAIVSCARERMHGGDPTVGSGLSSAVSLWPQVLLWSLVSATVGFVLRMVEERFEGLGRVAVGLIGVAWGVATYFVVPVLVAERLGPFAALKRSAQVLRKTWGEALVSNFGIGLIVFLLTLLSAVPLAAGIAIGTPVAVFGGLAITAVAFGLLMAVSSALNAILVTALYEYAAAGQAPSGFDEATLQGAFGARRARRRGF